MRHIELSQRQVAIVDDEDYGWLKGLCWYANWNPNARTFYAVRRTSTSIVSMHRLIMGTPIGCDVDHRDHDGLNNIRSNLRVATRAQNMANSRKRSGTTSKYKGVWSENNKWRAQIKINGRRKHLGYFVDEVDAAIVYNVAAKDAWGDYALLNVVELTLS